MPHRRGFFLDIFGEQAWSRSYALYLPSETTLQLVIGSHRKQLELDAGAASIDDKDGFGHG